MSAQIVVTVHAEVIDEEGDRTLVAERSVGQELDPDLLGADVYGGYRQSLVIASDTVDTMVSAVYPQRVVDA